MLVQNLRALSPLRVRNMNLKFKKLLANKTRIWGKKYTIALEFDLQIFRGQMEILES